MTKTLDCKYPGATAWGKNYQDPSGGRDCQNATNGSAPGYVLVDAEAEDETAEETR